MQPYLSSIAGYTTHLQTLESSETPLYGQSLAVETTIGLGGMFKDEHLAILKGGIEKWNPWITKRAEALWDWGEIGSGPPPYYADLHGADLHGLDLSHFIFLYTDLREADLSGANLSEANLTGTKLAGANFSKATLNDSLLGADLSGADLWQASLRGADLRRACMRGTVITAAALEGSRWHSAVVDNATFAKLDLSVALGLEEVRHQGPSVLTLDTLVLSKAKIPDVFLRGCGVPEPIIGGMKALFGAMAPIQFYSCFISYNHSDKEFARRLHDALQNAGYPLLA